MFRYQYPRKFMTDFFQAYFIDPIKYNTGYNIVNTATFALILVAAVIGTYLLLKRLGIKIDRDFFIGIMPYIALGGVLRSWEDLLEATKATAQLLNSPIKDFILLDAAGVPRNLLLISPIIYISIFILALSSLLISLIIASRAKFQYHKVWFAIGSVIIILVLAQLRFVNYPAMMLMLGIAAAWASLFYVARRANQKARTFFTLENYSILSVHMFDASTTFVALQFFGYFEQHVVANFFISIFGPVAMFAIKLPVVAAVLHYLDKEKENEKKNFIKIAILILGLGPGLRNFLRLGMGV